MRETVALQDASNDAHEIIRGIAARESALHPRPVRRKS
jgi:hypothetical protein